MGLHGRETGSLILGDHDDTAEDHLIGRGSGMYVEQVQEVDKTGTYAKRSITGRLYKNNFVPVLWADEQKSDDKDHPKTHPTVFGIALDTTPYPEDPSEVFRGQSSPIPGYRQRTRRLATPLLRYDPMDPSKVEDFAYLSDVIQIFNGAAGIVIKDGASKHTGLVNFYAGHQKGRPDAVVQFEELQPSDSGEGYAPRDFSASLLKVTTVKWADALTFRTPGTAQGDGKNSNGASATDLLQHAMDQHAIGQGIDPQTGLQFGTPGAAPDAASAQQTLSQHDQAAGIGVTPGTPATPGGGSGGVGETVDRSSTTSVSLAFKTNTLWGLIPEKKTAGTPSKAATTAGHGIQLALAGAAGGAVHGTGTTSSTTAGTLSDADKKANAAIDAGDDPNEGGEGWPLDFRDQISFSGKAGPKSNPFGLDSHGGQPTILGPEAGDPPDNKQVVFQGDTFNVSIDGTIQQQIDAASQNGGGHFDDSGNFIPNDVSGTTVVDKNPDVSDPLKFQYYSQGFNLLDRKTGKFRPCVPVFSRLGRAKPGPRGPKGDKGDRGPAGPPGPQGPGDKDKKKPPKGGGKPPRDKCKTPPGGADGPTTPTTGDGPTDNGDGGGGDPPPTGDPTGEPDPGLPPGEAGNAGDNGGGLRPPTEGGDGEGTGHGGPDAKKGTEATPCDQGGGGRTETTGTQVGDDALTNAWNDTSNEMAAMPEPGTGDAWDLPDAGTSDIQLDRPQDYDENTDQRVRLGGGIYQGRNAEPFTPPGGLVLMDSMDFSPRMRVGQALSHFGNQINANRAAFNGAFPFSTDATRTRGLHLANQNKPPQTGFFNFGDMVVIRSVPHVLSPDGDGKSVWAPVTPNTRPTRVFGRGKAENIRFKFNTTNQELAQKGIASQAKSTIDALPGFEYNPTTKSIDFKTTDHLVEGAIYGVRRNGTKDKVYNDVTGKSGLDAPTLNGLTAAQIEAAVIATSLTNRDVETAITLADKYCAAPVGYVLIGAAGTLTLVGDSVLRIEDNPPTELGAQPRALDLTHTVYAGQYEEILGTYRIGANGKLVLGPGDSIFSIFNPNVVLEIANLSNSKSGQSSTLVVDDNLSLNRNLSTAVTVADGYCLEPLGYYKILAGGTLTLAGDSVLRLSEVDPPQEPNASPRVLTQQHTVYDGFHEAVRGYYRIATNGILAIQGDGVFGVVDATPVEQGSNPRVLYTTHTVAHEFYEKIGGYYRIAANGVLLLQGDSIFRVEDPPANTKLGDPSFAYVQGQPLIDQYYLGVNTGTAGYTMKFLRGDGSWNTPVILGADPTADTVVKDPAGNAKITTAAADNVSSYSGTHKVTGTFRVKDIDIASVPALALGEIQVPNDAGGIPEIVIGLGS